MLSWMMQVEQQRKVVRAIQATHLVRLRQQQQQQHQHQQQQRMLAMQHNM